MKYKNKKEKNILWASGSYAVEMAFLMPMILGMLFAMLYVLFYQHDKWILYSELQQVLWQYEKQENTGTWKKKMQNKVWMVTVKECNIQQNTYTIQGKVKAKAKWKIPVIGYFLSDKQEITLTVKRDLWQPEQKIRWLEGK